MNRILQKLSHHFTLTSPSLSYPGVWICVAIIWLAIVVCTLLSVSSQSFSRTRKYFWSAVIIALPVVGLLAYLPFSLGEEIFPYIGFWKRPKQR